MVLSRQARKVATFLLNASLSPYAGVLSMSGV
jgi:hypothetical protein